MSREVVVVSGVRTAIGTYGGSLKDVAPTELAAQVVRDLGLDSAKVNPNGSGISLGHPIGATGALVTMCIGGGQGIAAIFERLA